MEDFPASKVHLQHATWLTGKFPSRRIVQTQELKHYKDHLVYILKQIFACKSFICVRLFVFFMLQTVLK